MDYTSTYEGYLMFRMTEAEHVARNYPKHWVEASANPEYERHLMEAYDASLVTNGQSSPECHMGGAWW